MRYGSVGDAVGAPYEDVPIEGMSAEVWEGLRIAASEPRERDLLETAFGNGRFFTEQVLGRAPRRIQWRGGRKQVFHHDLPVDLRVDEVYHVSCKYASRVLQNPSPQALFVDLLGRATPRARDWYGHVAPEELQAFYAACRGALRDFLDLPEEHVCLSRDERRQLSLCLHPLPAQLAEPYAVLCRAVSDASAHQWSTAVAREAGADTRLLWRLLRISSVPYYVLGASKSHGIIRLKVASTDDWKQSYRLRAFTVSTLENPGQPRVEWAAEVQREARSSAVKGHVEVRWSHGKFCGACEAKVYLDTPMDSVPGYTDLNTNAS
jgi:hypothetical protein